MGACGGDEQTGAERKTTAVGPVAARQDHGKHEQAAPVAAQAVPGSPAANTVPGDPVASGGAGDIPTQPEEKPVTPAASEQAPVLAPAGSVAFVVLSARELHRSQARLAKALGRGLRGNVTTLSGDSQMEEFALAILANETATYPTAWKSYRHVVVMQTTTAADVSDDTKYPGGSGFLGVFRTPSSTPLYIEQGGYLWPDAYANVLPIINTLTKETTR